MPPPSVHGQDQPRRKASAKTSYLMCTFRITVSKLCSSRQKKIQAKTKYSVALQNARLATSDRSGGSTPRTCTTSGDNVKSCPGEQQTPVTTSQSVGTHFFSDE
jgi:hypothetical protein